MKLPPINPETKAIAHRHRRYAGRILRMLCSIGIKHSRRKVSMALMDLTPKQMVGMVKHLEAVRLATVNKKGMPLAPEYVRHSIGGR